MYGNTPFGEDGSARELTADQRRALRRDLSDVAAHTRELLPNEFAVGSEITQGTSGPRATVAVQPPVGSIVSADYTLAAAAAIDETDREDIAMDLAASAVLEVKQAVPDDPAPTAQ